MSGKESPVVAAMTMLVVGGGIKVVEQRIRFGVGRWLVFVVHQQHGIIQQERYRFVPSDELASKTVADIRSVPAASRVGSILVSTRLPKF